MCGGIVSAMTFSSPQRHASWPFILLFNMGRIASYMLVGAIAGTFGERLQLLPNYIFDADGTLSAGQSIPDWFGPVRRRYFHAGNAH